MKLLPEQKLTAQEPAPEDRDPDSDRSMIELDGIGVSGSEYAHDADENRSTPLAANGLLSYLNAPLERSSLVLLDLVEAALQVGFSTTVRLPLVAAMNFCYHEMRRKGRSN